MTGIPLSLNQNVVGKLCSRRRFRSEPFIVLFAIGEEIAISSRLCEIFHSFIWSSMESIFFFLHRFFTALAEALTTTQPISGFACYLPRNGHKRSSRQRPVHNNFWGIDPKNSSDSDELDLHRGPCFVLKTTKYLSDMSPAEVSASVHTKTPPATPQDGGVGRYILVSLCWWCS